MRGASRYWNVLCLDLGSGFQGVFVKIHQVVYLHVYFNACLLHFNNDNEWTIWSRVKALESPFGDAEFEMCKQAGGSAQGAVEVRDSGLSRNPGLQTWK